MEAFVGPLVGKLQDVALSEANALAAVDNDIRRLRDKLMWVQAFIREADPSSRLADNELVRVLVLQTRDVAFDAEDAIDQYYLLVEPLRSPRGISWARLFFDGNLLSRLSMQFTVRHSLSGKIALMNERLEDIIKNKDKYKLDAAVAPTEGPTPKWIASPATTIYGRLSWNEKPRDLIGRSEEQEKLRNILLGQCNASQDKVVNVVGKSGIGKSSLVRQVYEDKKIRSHFDIRIWRSFPPETSDWVVLQKIYRKISDKCTKLDNGINQEVEGLIRDINCRGGRTKQREVIGKLKVKMEEQLKKKRYLLVIDYRQISITKWQRIDSDLPKSAEGSKIVLITEIKDEYTNTESTIHLEPLSKDDSKTLLCRYKLAGNQVNMDKIFEITQGLPLAMELLAKLLQTMEKHRRDLVFDHISNRSQKQAKRLEIILSLCLNDLPHDLKSCFLYLAGFPENKFISARKLVLLWMAEGLLAPKDGKKMEKIGHRYVKEMITRGLVQLVAKNIRGNVESIAIHEQIYAFLRAQAREQSFLEVHYGHYVPAASTVRRLSLQNYNNRFSALTNRLPKLRTVMSYFEEDHVQNENEGMSSKEGSDAVNMHGLLRGSPFLRVINLEGLDVGSTLPNKLGDMVHLRYLGVRLTKLSEVPCSIGNLSNLQTLDVRETGINSLPDAFWKIGTLRHVLGTRLQFPHPKSVGELKYLETLESASIEDDNGWDGTIIKKMLNLRALHVEGLKNSHQEALEVALKTLNYLVELALSGEAIRIDIKNHHKDKLVSAKLQGKLDIMEGSSNSLEQISLPNLSKLVLNSTHVRQGFIQKLAFLPNLTHLHLLKESFDDKTLEFPSDGFKKLKCLRVSHLDELNVEKKIVVRSEMKELESVELIAFSGDIEAEDPTTLDRKINKTFYGKEIKQIKQNSGPC